MKINKIKLFALLTLIFCSCDNKSSSTKVVDLIPVKTGNEYQYIDSNDKIKINPQFSEATIFRDGVALVMPSGKNSKWGFIDKKGKYTLNAKYKSATIFSEGFAWVVNENKAPEAINKKGEVKFTMPSASKVRIFSDNLAAFSNINKVGDEKWGFVNKEGEIVIKPQFVQTLNFSDGKCGVMNDAGDWGFINKEGNIVINYQFDKVKSFKSGKCVVKSSRKMGVIDENGKYIINPQFSDVYIDGEILMIKQNGKYGWSDEKGNIIINPQFNGAYIFGGNNMTPIKSGNDYGFINSEGKIVINPQFDLALPFNGNIALVIVSRNIGFIDKEGKFVINPQYNGTSNDLLKYFLSGESDYEEVETDFFDLESIVSFVDFERPEGFSFDSTFGEIIENYDVNEDVFSRRKIEHLIISRKNITNQSEYDFYANGNAFYGEKVQKGSGYYSYEDIEWKFSKNEKPSSYIYLISLFRKAFDKQNVLIDELEKKLIENGYTESPFRELVYDSSDKKTNVEIKKVRENQVSIKITNRDIKVGDIPSEEEMSEAPIQE